MSETEFQRWLTNLVPTYASELEESLRLTPGDAASKAEMDVHGMLPRGLDTPDHWLWIVVDDADGRVGHLWMARMAEGGAARALICDVEIDAPHRGRGLGREAMLLAEQEALARGLQRIDLS